MTAETPTRSKRRRRRRGREDGPPPAPAINFKRSIPLYEMAPAEAVERIHLSTLDLLERSGIEFHSAPALETWRKAGAEVEGERVRIPRELLLEQVALAPEQFVQRARNPANSVTIGLDQVAFSPNYGSPFVRDLSGERRYARLGDFEDLARLAQMTPSCNHAGGVLCEPMDVPIPKRHLDMTHALMRLTDKPFMGSVTAGERAQDCVDMCRILFGADFVERNTVIMGLVNCNSPLVWDDTMLAAVRAYTEAGQAMIVSPFCMQGASAPITTAGAMVQINAEALAAVAYMQLLRPGTPAIYGIAPSTVSMLSGAPMYGAAEAMFLTFLGNQLARRYGVPTRAQGMRTTAKLADAQAGYESVQSMWPAVMAGGHFHTHTFGWLESGLSACLAKFVMDGDQATVFLRLMAGVTVDDETLAMDAFEEVGPGGQYLGCANTLRHYRDAFFIPPTSFIDTYEQWQEEGAADTLQRATEIARQRLAAHEPPPLDAGTADALAEFVARRKAELPDSNF